MVDLEIPCGVSSVPDFYLLDNVEVRKKWMLRSWGLNSNDEPRRWPSQREIKDHRAAHQWLWPPSQPRDSPFTSTARCPGLTVSGPAVDLSPWWATNTPSAWTSEPTCWQTRSVRGPTCSVWPPWLGWVSPASTTSWRSSTSIRTLHFTQLSTSQRSRQAEWPPGSSSSPSCWASSCSASSSSVSSSSSSSNANQTTRKLCWMIRRPRLGLMWRLTRKIGLWWENRTKQ